MKPCSTTRRPDDMKILFSAARIRRRLDRLAEEIAHHVSNRELIIVAILKGSYVFLADLSRSLARQDIHVIVDFLGISSYGSGTTSSGKVRIRHDLSIPLKGKPVLLLDDILDTGLTLRHATDLLRRRGAHNIRTCVLLDKPARRRIPIEADHVGFTVADTFVVGYGLDYNNRYRHLPHIAELRAGSKPAVRTGT